MKVYINLIILVLVLTVSARKKNFKKTTLKSKNSLLPEWLVNKDNGEYKIPTMLCDNLEENIEFYGVKFTNPETKISNNGIFYLAPGSEERLTAAQIKRQDYVSNLRRAIDTYAYSFWPIAPEKVIMTSDIQEVSIGFDAAVDDKKRPNKRPYVGKHQKESLDLLLNDSNNEEVNSEEKKKQAKQTEENRLTAIYNSLILHQRVKDHEGWKKAGKFNDFFIGDLEKECEKGTQVVVATGHSFYWQNFVKTYSSNAGTCKGASDDKLGNGSLLSMVVKFDNNCKRFANHPVANCKLLYGSFHNKEKTNCKESSNNDQNSEIAEGMKNGDRQILLIAQRHGTSHWNVKSEKGLISKVEEAFQSDSSLWPTGILDAISVFKRLNKK